MPRLPWPPILLVLAILGASALGRVVPLNVPAPDAVRTGARVLGWVLIACALLVELRSAVGLWRRGTTVLPNREATALVTDGLHARSRNPIYVAHVTIVIGYALVRWNPWGLVAACAVFALLDRLAIRPEERFLAEVFGTAYDDYRARVRRWL